MNHYYDNVELTIKDIAGKMIYSTHESGIHKMEMNTKNLVGGIYIVSVKGLDFLETKKLIIAK